MSKKPWSPNSAILSCMRRTFSRSPLVRGVLDESIHPTIKGKRGGKMYTCSECRKAFTANKVEVDHVDPVVPLNSTLAILIEEKGWNFVADRLFCPPSKLRVLCKDCHKGITDIQKRQRRDYKRLRDYQAVICIETNEYYINSFQASEKLGLKTHTGIENCCRNLQKTAGGFTWKYDERF